jgi:Putative Actinobacterial Holin-X, holin superfamily III
MAESYGDLKNRSGSVRGPVGVDDSSVPELMRQLSDQTVSLVRQEVDLAKAEFAAKGKRAGLGAGLFGGASVFGLYALGALVACAILALSLVMSGWLAALIVAAVLGLIAGVLALVGTKNLKRGVPPSPEETIESVKEDVEWTKQRVREGRR